VSAPRASLVALALAFAVPELAGFSCGQPGDPLPTPAMECSAILPTPDQSTLVPDGGTLPVEVGVRGATDFTAWSDGGVAHILRGFQGGTMFPFWVRVGGASSSCANFSYTIYLDSTDGGRAGNAGYAVMLDSQGLTDALIQQLYECGPPESCNGRTALVEVDASDAAGRVGSASVRVTLAYP
jgi:hypothetical protein